MTGLGGVNAEALGAAIVRPPPPPPRCAGFTSIGWNGAGGATSVVNSLASCTAGGLVVMDHSRQNNPTCIATDITPDFLFTRYRPHVSGRATGFEVTSSGGSFSGCTISAIFAKIDRYQGIVYW